jgi:mannose-6-phosphate isomerase-like protein (cupin superfamily)
MTKPNPQSVPATIDALTFLPDRTPTTTGEQSAAAFARLADYRDGAIFVGHWAGKSEWERHPVGDEIVMVIDGRTTMFFLTDGEETSAELGAGELVVVPQNTWHRFETPDFVKVMSVTPQPTDHRIDRPQ